jgi:hypothetical protein
VKSYAGVFSGIFGPVPNTYPYGNFAVFMGAPAPQLDIGFQIWPLLFWLVTVKEGLLSPRPRREHWREFI